MSEVDCHTEIGSAGLGNSEKCRRSVAQKELAEQRAAAEEKAAGTVAEAEATAERLVADARDELARLHTVRDLTHTELESLYAKLRAALDASRATPPEADHE